MYVEMCSQGAVKADNYKCRHERWRFLTGPLHPSSAMLGEEAPPTCTWKTFRCPMVARSS